MSEQNPLFQTEKKVERISTIWTEKYRPQNFDQIKGQQEIVSKIKAFVESGNMPHLLFSGPAGVGKTTLSLVIAKQLFGENWRQNTLELNASDERGIDVIRVKVKDFARTRSIGNVPFKLIYLDESDALTRDAQQALRRTMENYTKTCRFILSCNYSSKIIDPIQSRCAVFRFKPLPEDQILMVIDKVAGQEGLSISEDAKKALYEVCGGDCRRLENIMQSCAVINKNIDLELVYSMASVAKPKEVNEVLSIAVTGDFLTARKKLLDLMLNYGLSGLDIIRQIQKEIWNLAIDDRTKVKLINKVGEIEFRMVEGSDEYIQLESLLAYVMLAGTSK
jgi:replication factor C small subunit